MELNTNTYTLPDGAMPYEQLTTYYKACIQQRDELIAALEGTLHVFAEQAESTRALTRTELEQLAFARVAIAKARA